MVVISVSLSAKELREFDEAADQAGFSSRSDAVRDALHRFVVNNNWSQEVEGHSSCVVSVIYADKKKHNVHEITHKYADLMHSSMHTHLDHRCVEQIVVDGPSSEVKKMLAELSAQKDVRIALSVF
jgi:CopG family nickel-responsive transcriptional regulator